MSTRRKRGTGALKAASTGGDAPVVISRTKPTKLVVAGAQAAKNGNSRMQLDPRDHSQSAVEAVEEFFNLAVDELAALRTRAEIEAIERACDLILEREAAGGRVHVTGVGKSEHVARYFASMLASSGTPAYFLHATECLHGSAGQVCPNDVGIAISNSGTTPELMRAVDVLRDMGTRIIGVSSDRSSPLAAASDVLLYVGVENEGGILNLVPRASVLAKIYVLCGLSVALEARKGVTREQYARWHPGGEIGKRIREG